MAVDATSTVLPATTARRGGILGRSPKFWRDALAGWGFASPFVIGFLIFTLIPMVLSIYYAFTTYNISTEPRWVGLYNIEALLASVPFRRSVYNTLWYAVVSTPLAIVGSLLLAILLNEKVRGENSFRTLYYLPAVLSGVPTAMLWLWLLNPGTGLINVFLRSIGIDNPPSWLYDSTWAKPAMVMMRMWALGSGAIIFLAGLQDIPDHLHEAAEIDGANRWQRFWHVTLPMLSPTMFFQVVTGIIAVFQIFGPIYVWTYTTGAAGAGSAGPQDSLLFYALLLYQIAFGRSGRTDLGRASMMAWLLFVFILILTIIQFRLARRWVYYESGPEGGL
jgi:multiple sugar transport system permease protein